MALGIILVLGGARSGKSEFGEHLAARAVTDAGVTYVATSPTVASDADWTARVVAHKRRRPKSWRTVEVAGGRELPVVLDDEHGTVLVDSLGAWVAATPEMNVESAALVDALRRRSGRGDLSILVSEEVGLGVHPTTEVGRHFRDVLGDVNRAVSSVADAVYLVVAGRVVDLSGAEPLERWVNCEAP
jgi:adenosylcobinamide kinase / adenosylcobinamide-phosphate guanylyltransferase